MTQKDEQARRIFAERAQFYTTSQAHTDPEVLAAVVQLAQPDSGWEVLDVGTGTGHTAFALASHVRHIVGVDITQEMLDEARMLKNEQSITNVDFRVANAHALPFADGSFDLVTCRRAAHHFSRIRVALAEMNRVLKPGGRLVIDDRSAPEDTLGAALMNQLDWYHDESHVREYRPSEWLQLLTSAGFQVDDLKTYIKHRPLSALTEKTTKDNAEAIRSIVENLTEDLRQALDVRQVDDELAMNHWYLMLAATKQS